MANPRSQPEEVRRTLAQHLIGDAVGSEARVAGLGWFSHVRPIRNRPARHTPRGRPDRRPARNAALRLGPNEANCVPPTSSLVASDPPTPSQPPRLTHSRPP